MHTPETGHDEKITRILERLASLLKLSMIVAIYFSLCVLIILVIVGAAP